MDRRRFLQFGIALFIEGVGMVAVGAKASRNGAKVREERVKLVQLDIRTIRIPIRGTTVLISERMSEETVQKMAGKHAGEAQLPSSPKVAADDFQRSLYLMPGAKFTDKHPRFGFPAIAFKCAMVDAANDMGVKMTEAKRAFHVVDDAGGLVEINYREVKMRTDTPRNANGNPDVRYRAEFHGWSAILTIRYNASVISAEQVVNVCNAAGFGVGVGGWRIKGKKSSGWAGGWEVMVDKPQFHKARPGGARHGTPRSG